MGKKFSASIYAMEEAIKNAGHKKDSSVCEHWGTQWGKLKEQVIRLGIDKQFMQ